MFVSKRYIVELENQVMKLQAALDEEKKYSKELVERLLRKEAVPQTPVKARLEAQADMETLMDQINIFKDLDGGDDDDSGKAINQISELVSE